MIFNTNIFKIHFYWICYGTYNNDTVHWLIVVIILFSQCSETKLLRRTIIDKPQIIDRFQHTLSLSITDACTPVIFMCLVLLPGQKGSTIMLLLRNVFLSISDFTFFFRVYFEYFAVFDYVSFDIIFICNHWCPNDINFEDKSRLWLKWTIYKLEQSNCDPFVHDFVTCMQWKPTHTIDNFSSASLSFLIIDK